MAKNTAAPSAADNGLLVSVIDSCFKWLKKTTFNNFLESNEKWFSRLGLFMLYIIAALCLIVAFVIPAKYSAFSWGACLGLGLLAFFTILLFQYIAAKSLPCLTNQIKNTPVKISTVAILDITCLLNAIFGIICFIGGLIIAINLSDFSYFLLGVGLTILSLYWMAMCLNPESLNVKIAQDSSAGEEFIGLLTFFAKGSLKLLPILFCGSVLSAAYLLCKLMFENFQYKEELYQYLSDISIYASGALLPLAGYLTFLFYYFTIDIARAILSIPEKLDR